MYEQRAAENLARAKRELSSELWAGVMPVVSYKNACFINNELAGIEIPADLCERFRACGPGTGGGYRGETALSSVEMVEDTADGYYVITPLRRADIVCRIVKAESMIIIGEKLNSSIPSTLQGLNEKTRILSRTSHGGRGSGRAYLDLNTGMRRRKEMLVWAAGLALKAAPGCALMADSTSPGALRYLFENVELENAAINSVTLEEDRLSGVLPLVREFKTAIVGMPIDGDGIPKTAERRGKMRAS